ncbi:hypothetical protein GCM10022295_92560 [Streptomyces osmaniensis]|uniref:Uncharacterized protein n=1 Tax=Streptomyces osmaniensis TaxID=593134 RepID=A0ABP6Z3Q3_9ACTN
MQVRSSCRLQTEPKLKKLTARPRRQMWRASAFPSNDEASSCCDQTPNSEAKDDGVYAPMLIVLFPVTVQGDPGVEHVAVPAASVTVKGSSPWN